MLRRETEAELEALLTEPEPETEDDDQNEYDCREARLGQQYDAINLLDEVVENRIYIWGSVCGNHPL